MSWKKNGLSYLVWAIYVLAVGVGLLGIAETISVSLGGNLVFAILGCVVYLAVAGALVFLLQRYAPLGCGFRKSVIWQVVEAVVVVLLLGIGFMLRLEGLENGSESAAYFETASIRGEQGVPQLMHGAVYFYVHLLRILFYFLGNKFTVAVVLQVVLQMLAVLLLFFAIRGLVGRVTAVVMLSFSMCSPYMIQGALTLSPEMLYLLFCSAVLCLLAVECKGLLRPWVYLLLGALVSVMIYLDVAGILIFLIAIGAIFCRRNEEPDKRARLWAVLACILGAMAGFFLWIGLDSYLSGRRFFNVLRAWYSLYCPEGFVIPATFGTPGIPVEYIILFGLLGFGIFSFWCDRYLERIKTWGIAIIVLSLSACYGIFTPEMPGSIYIYLLFTLLAGFAVEDCLRISMRLKKERAEEPQLIEIAEQELPEKQSDPIQVQPEEASLQEKKPVQYIENPLPLPKKHVRRVLDYSIRDGKSKDDFDIDVDESDDFDI